jgi:hypothetical protein
MERVLASRFGTVGLLPFEVKLLPKPAARREDAQPWWGSYELHFKLIDGKRHPS